MSKRNMKPFTVEIHKQAKYEEYLQLKGYAFKSRSLYVDTMKRFLRWCIEQNIPTMQVSYNDVLAYVNVCKQRGNKPISLQKVVLDIKRYYTFLMEENDVQDNPATNIEIKGVKRKILYETFKTEELEKIYITYAGMQVKQSTAASRIAHKRNKVILGLVIYQGICTQELAEMKVSDVLLQQGKVSVPGSGRTEGRELKLEAFQLYDLMDYINDTRKLILALSAVQSDKLFLSTGGSDKFHNVMQKLLEAVHKLEPRVKEIKQLRASVITNWLKVHNIRKVQQMAGHRYVSSTEAYQVNNMDDLKEDVKRYHPLG